GRNRAGDYLNMRGGSVAAWNPPIDELFLCSGDREAGLDRGWPEKGAGRLRTRAQPARRSATRGRPVTIGIGDGGNEIGMGAVRAKIARLDALRARIAAVVRVDHLVVAGVSNWGGYGVVAALGRLTGSDLLHTPELERRLIAACVEAGGCDGVTRRREPTVDSIGPDAHAAVVDLLRLASRSGIMGGSTARRGTRR
ncbi:MAG: glutamate cyclase domain-containing protein, partial [Candidatus Rokuibacteriota bacterium]